MTQRKRHLDVSDLFQTQNPIFLCLNPTRSQVNAREHSVPGAAPGRVAAADGAVVAFTITSLVNKFKVHIQPFSPGFGGEGACRKDLSGIVCCVEVHYLPL